MEYSDFDKMPVQQICIVQMRENRDMTSENSHQFQFEDTLGSPLIVPAPENTENLLFSSNNCSHETVG